MALLDGPRTLLQLENAFKQLIQDAWLDNEALSRALGPAVRVWLKQSPLEGFVDAIVSLGDIFRPPCTTP